MLKNIFRYVMILALVGSFVWTIWFLYNKSQKPTVVFDTKTPSYQTIVQKTVATGAVIPRREVFIKPQVSGIIDQIFVEAGKMINKGDVIARVRIIPNMVSLNEAESRVNRAQISFDQARVDFERYKALFNEKVVSPAEFQPYQINMRNAQEELNTAKNNLDLIREGVSRATGSVSNTLIRSTINGMVLDVPVKEGFSVIEANNFNEGTTIASVADMGEMIFEGKVDESEVGKIKKGMELELTVGAIDNKKFNAKLEYIAPKGVEENGAIQFQIRAAVSVDNSEFLRAGYSANADIILDKKEKVLSIPESLLQFSGDSTFVEVEQGAGQWKKVMIKTGISDGINIQIVDGVQEKDKIKVPQMDAPAES
jgi:HlyD family secretion protein